MGTRSYKFFQVLGVFEALGQAAQRSCGCHTPGSVQGQSEWGLDQPGLVKSAHGKGWNEEL